MYNMLKKTNRTLRGEVVEFARRLIRVPSRSLEEAQVADLVESKMNELHYDRVLRDEAGNVLGIIDGREPGPTLLVNAHMDTVDADEEKWDSPPLQARLEDGRLRGLGASDCKGGLAACVYAGELLRRCMLPFRGNLVVAATVAEENGRSLGVRVLMEETLSELGMTPDYAVLGEPTDLRLFHGHDGWAELSVRLDGENPFHVRDAAEAISRELRSALEQTAEDDETEFAWLQGPHFEERGDARRARIQLNRRLRGTEEIGEVTRRLRRDAAAAANATGSVALEVDVAEQDQQLYTGRTVTVRNVTRAWETNPFHHLIERARQTLRAAGIDPRPGKWKLRRLGMGTAGSVLVNDFNVPTVGFGPGSEVEAHSPNECVEVDKLGRAVYGLASIAHGLVGVPVFGWTSDEI
jgi:acetylornithine deacetylase/succinyl-diaminopimelate desuccinylase-like protein